jgi:IS4 transposase
MSAGRRMGLVGCKREVQAFIGDCCDELLESVVVDTIKKSTVELFAIGQVIRLQLEEWNTDLRSEQEG